jgi:NAD(P)-dependent dehydrogenase (short-subunit alcohol dehydrogenase family)
MEQRRVAITGVSRGLGRAMVSQFVELGHQVSGCCRDAGTAAELQTQYGDSHLFQVADVTNRGTIAAWRQATCDAFGVPDLLLNNAALINKNAPLWEVGSDEFSAILQVNIGGIHNVIAEFVPAMIRAGTGVIVNFSSTWGRSTSPEVAPYCATKFAVEGLTKALASELPDGLCAVPFNPGIINTDMLQSCFGSQASAFPSADDWAAETVPRLLEIGRKDNGRSL